MGMAIYRNLKASFPTFEILLCDKRSTQLEEVAKAKIYTDPKALHDCSAVIFAVKPYDLEQLSLELEGCLKECLIISVLAGVSLVEFIKATGANKVIRAMPNLPVLVGKGVIGWISSKNVKKGDKTFARQIFSAMGTEIELSDEKMLDSITALFGSGPAYFFYLCELLSAKALELGFSPQDAEKLAEKTCIGTAALLDLEIQSAEKWRHAVTSKGGTTEAAINYMQKHSFAKIFAHAIEEAKSHAVRSKKGKR